MPVVKGRPESAGPSVFQTGLRDALRTAVAAGVATWIYQYLDLLNGYWVAISAVIVMQANVGASVRASLVRIYGTVVGAVMGVLFAYAGPASPVTMAGSCGTAVLLCSILPVLRDGARLAGVTALIVMISNTTTPLHTGAIRLTENLLGICVAIVVSVLFLPWHARKKIRGTTASALRASAACYRLIYNGHTAGGDSSSALEAAQQKLANALAENAKLLHDAENEPAFLADNPGVLYSVTLTRIMYHLHLMKGDIAPTHDPSLTTVLQPELGTLFACTLNAFDLLIEELDRPARQEGLDLKAATNAAQQKLQSAREHRLFSPYSSDGMLSLFALYSGMIEIADDIAALRRRMELEA